MVSYFVYAKDFSGSTEGSRYFHENGMKSLQQFKNDVEMVKKEMIASGEPSTETKIIYLHWGDKCYEVDEEVTEQSYKELKSGQMGTEPITIIKWIRSNCSISGENHKIKLLYIVTDGMIERGDAVKCFKLNQNMFYEIVVFHGFNECLEDIDLSIAASFLKCRCRVYRNYVLIDNVNISEEFDYDKIALENFTTEENNLKSYIKLKYINKSEHDLVALQEINKLTKLRNRLYVELSSKSKQTESKLDTRDKNVFLCEFINTDWFKNLMSRSHGLKVKIDKLISTLINYIVNDKKSYAFDAIKYEIKYCETIEEEPIVDIFADEEEIPFPDIILDEDKGIPVILLTRCNLLNKLIFGSKKESTAVSPASFNKFKSAMECPLFLINDSDISESIGYFYTLNVYKQLLTNTNKTEPRTRRPFHGGIVLIDTDEFDKYNDYILAAAYFNSRKIHYNVGLFYYVIWKNCENKEWMDRNVVQKFKKYAMRRISTTLCKIGLSGLPLDPPHVTWLPTALWYCVELSSSIFKDDPLHFMHERLRMYYDVAHYMVEILKYFNCNLDLDLIEERIEIIRYVNALKKIPTHREKVYYLLRNIFKNINGFLVSEIEKPYNLGKLNYLKMNHKDMLRGDVLKEMVHLNDYVHLMHFINDPNRSKDGKCIFKICEKTLRPFFTVDNNKSFYSELLNLSKKITINNDDDKDKINITYDSIASLDFNKTLSLFNQFINCVIDTRTYPTLTEYAKYITKKKRYDGDLVTIFPSNVFYMATEVYSLYQDIMLKVDVKKFIYLSKSYVNRLKRVRVEEIVNFNNDSEIKQFISNEEQKVNLKKPAKCESGSRTKGSVAANIINLLCQFIHLVNGA